MADVLGHQILQRRTSSWHFYSLNAYFYSDLFARILPILELKKIKTNMTVESKMTATWVMTIQSTYDVLKTGELFRFSDNFPTN